MSLKTAIKSITRSAFAASDEMFLGYNDRIYNTVYYPNNLGI